MTKQRPKDMEIVDNPVRDTVILGTCSYPLREDFYMFPQYVTISEIVKHPIHGFDMRVEQFRNHVSMMNKRLFIVAVSPELENDSIPGDDKSFVNVVVVTDSEKPECFPMCITGVLKNNILDRIQNGTIVTNENGILDFPFYTVIKTGKSKKSGNEYYFFANPLKD